MPTVLTKLSSLVLPASLGKILPGATYGSASVPLTQNVTPTEQDGVTPVRSFSGVFITAFPGTLGVAANSGNVYVTNSAAAPDVTNFTNVVGILSPGQSWPKSKEWANVCDIGNLYIGAENDTDFALVVIDQF